MNTSATLEKMGLMRLGGMRQAYQTSLETNSSMTADELIAYLVETEYNDRENRKTERLLKAAHFRYQAYIEEIDYSASRGLDKGQMLRYAGCDFIRNKENIIITGPTGAGKSYIASALGRQACQLGYKVYYSSIGKLLTKMKMLKADNSDIREINKIAKSDLLILDDFGLQKLDTQGRLLLLEIIEDRHSLRSSLITSQLPVSDWHHSIGDSTIADALLDRLIHTARRIELRGESMRKKTGKAAREKNNN